MVTSTTRPLCSNRSRHPRAPTKSSVASKFQRVQPSCNRSPTPCSTCTSTSLTAPNNWLQEFSVLWPWRTSCKRSMCPTCLPTWSSYCNSENNWKSWWSVKRTLTSRVMRREDSISGLVPSITGVCRILSCPSTWPIVWPSPSKKVWILSTRR